MLKSVICVLEQYKHIPTEQTGECKLDAGGYFIINGSEKTVLGQERAAENKIQCFNTSKNNKWAWTAEIKSVPDFKCISPKQITMYISSKNNGFGHSLYIQIPRIKVPIPLFILFRALGVETDKAICEKIVLNVDKGKEVKELLFALKASIVDSNKFINKEDALMYITNNAMYTPLNGDKESGNKKKRSFTIDVLETDLFPHCKKMDQKVYFLGYMANQLLKTSLGWREVDDRDSYLNKRVDLVGILLNNLFRNYFNKLVKDMQKQIVREINNGSWRSTDNYKTIVNMTNIYKIVKSTTIENGLKRALATGDFGLKQATSNKVGVAQVLNRLTYISSLSHSRRVNTPIDKSGKLIPPRKLHSTSWGFLCPAETPEGHGVGVVKNLAYLTHITIPSNSEPLYDYVNEHIIEFAELDKETLFNGVKVFINGTWIGITNDPIKLYNDLKIKKYKGNINIYTSIIFDYQRLEIRICNDSGRLTRPVLKVNNGKLLITNDIIKQIKRYPHIETIPLKNTQNNLK